MLKGSPKKQINKTDLWASFALAYAVQTVAFIAQWALGVDFGDNNEFVATVAPAIATLIIRYLRDNAKGTDNAEELSG